MRRRSIPPLFALVFFLAPAVRASVAAATIVAKAGDASITHDAAAGTWMLTAAGTALTLAIDPSRDFAILNLVTTSGKAWTTAVAADSFVHAGNQTVAFGSRAHFAYQDVTIETPGRTLQLNATFMLTSENLRVTRHYAIVSGSPSFETWTTYAPATKPVTLSDLNALLLTVPAGTLRWLTGLQGDTTSLQDTAAFTLEQKTLAIGEQFALGAKGRASEQSVPWFAIDGAQDEFYAALMWSGAWSLGFSRTSAGLALTFSLAPMSTTPDGSMDGPHVVFGVVAGGLTQATAALRSYILDGLRHGRPLTPLVTYNTWYAYGAGIDETLARGEMERAAALGAELFVIDAGWYNGAGAAGQADFDAGLGSWTPDPARFPDGLRPLRDYAHSLGLRFGIWVEPERVNLALVGRSGVEERWLATSGGSYGADHAGQICLANDAARRWLLDRLTSLIDEVEPDYLKWDNNMWINCDRDGHGHGATDGNFSHVNGLYDLLSTLRDRYPGLLIENVSGGGNRLDIGMLRYSDAGWMDDRTAPSVHVRHNLEGLSVVFPPAYLLSLSPTTKPSRSTGRLICRSTSAAEWMERSVCVSRAMGSQRARKQASRAKSRSTRPCGRR
jgi:alpha-galactosidase